MNETILILVTIRYIIHTYIIIMIPCILLKVIIANMSI